MALDFETSIDEIEQKIDLLANTNNGGNMDTKLLSALQDNLQNEVEKVYSDLNPWQTVQVARHLSRPRFMDYIKMIFTDFIEIHGDRGFRDDLALVTGMAKLGGEKVFVIGQQKGTGMEEARKRNFGMARPEGYRKALRVMKLANKFNRPILTFIDTPGAYPGLDAEERGQGEAIAMNLREMAKLQVPVIATVIGEGGSGGALGIGVANSILMLNYSIYSVISPEGCASILWRDSAMAPDAAKALNLTAGDLKRLGIVDDIIDEPYGGAHRYPEITAENVKERLIKELKDLKKLSKTKVMDKRMEKFLKIGEFSEKPLNY